MGKEGKYVEALEDQGLFENPGHRTRFKELVDCYGHYPFFNPGLCKCMYLSAWDEEHFAIILQILSDLAIGRERDTEEMHIQGDALAREETGGESYMYRLSNAFLAGEEFVMDEDAELPGDYPYIISRAMEAAKVIDSCS